MNNYTPVCLITGVILSVILLSSCASSGDTRVDRSSRIYEKNYNEMVRIVQRVVKSGEFEIAYSNSSEDPSKFFLVYSEEIAVRGNSIQRVQGEITIEKVSENKTKVNIKNPEYDAMISPNTQRDYRRYFFTRIDDLVNKSGS